MPGLNDYGVSGIDGNRHLPPQQGLVTYYPSAPFQSQLAPALWVKMSEEIPPELSMILLTKAPNPDGDGHIELEGCVPQPVSLARLDGSFDMLAESVSFEIPLDAPLITHVGFVCGDGRLAYYGALVSTRRSTVQAKTLTFRPEHVKVRRLQKLPVARPSRGSR